MRVARIPLAFAIERNRADSRASIYDSPALFLSLLCSLLMREHSLQDSRPRTRLDARVANRDARNPRAEINTPAQMNEKQMHARIQNSSLALVL